MQIYICRNDGADGGGRWEGYYVSVGGNVGMFNKCGILVGEPLILRKRFTLIQRVP